MSQQFSLLTTMEGEQTKCRTLQIPAQVSCLSSVDSRRLLVGSDDGSVRLYDLDTFKVLKAIRGLAPVSSVAFHTTAGVWVASGRQALQFSLGSDKLISTLADASRTLDIGADHDDVLGELSINSKGTQMAFCTDSGSVGVVDLQTAKITRMRQSHTNVCGSVRFIPGRPNEFVSGGYDFALIHFDLGRGSILSRDDLSTAPPTSGVSLSPPFILTMGISPTGVIAAGTADGRLYIGTGGENLSEVLRSGQKRQRKWNGLRKDGRIIVDAAEGPIVALTFTGPRELLTCTLLGQVTHHQIHGSAADGTLSLEPRWTRKTKDVYKVNSITYAGESIIIGGFHKDGKGMIGAWPIDRGSTKGSGS